MKAALLKKASVVAVLAASWALAWACEVTPYPVSNLGAQQSIHTPALGFDLASTADPAWLPEMSNSVIAQASEGVFSASTDLNQVLEPTAAGTTTPLCNEQQ